MAINIKVLKSQWEEMNKPKRLQAPKEETLTSWFHSPFIDFDDPAIPLWERKAKFMKWIRRKRGMTEQKAIAACARKFYHEERES